MLKNIFRIVLKVTILSLIVFSVYYFGIMRPKIFNAQNVSQTIEVLRIHKNLLTQNRIAYVALTKLDGNSVNFDGERSSLVNSLKETNSKGISDTEAKNTIPNVNGELSIRFPELLTDTSSVYEEQTVILDKVFATKTFDEGIAILESSEAVDLLTRQTNLILEYEWWIRKLAE